MPSPLRAYWWSTRREPRTLAIELRDRAASWTRTAWPAQRAFTNHGDELNTLVLPLMLDRPVRWAPLGREDLIGIGSVLGLYMRHGGRGVVLGSGAPEADILPADVASIADRFLAVRGPMTRSLLGLSDGVALGDPGLVVRTYGIVPGARRRGRLLVPHFHAYGTTRGRRILQEFRTQGYRVMSPTTAPHEMVRAIGRAESVVTSGMHGMIIAHALRTPVTLVSLDDDDPRMPGRKFRDYAASVGSAGRVSRWRDAVVRSSAARLDALAVAEDESISATVDDLVDGLLAASRPLRAT